MLTINNQCGVHRLSCQSVCGHMENLTPALTDSNKFATLIGHQAKWSVVRLRIRSVIWRSDTRAKIAGFSMVGRTGEPKGSPLHMAVMRILLRLATRVSHLCGQFSKTNHMEVSL